MLAVDPGEYRVIVSMADSEGRVGSVSRAVTAFQLDGPGLVARRLAGRRVRGRREADARSPHRAGDIGTDGCDDGSVFSVSSRALEATLDILSSEDGAPLATLPMRIGAGPSPEIANMSAQFNAAALPPGRYLARGSIRQGGKPQGHMLRPFRVVADGRRPPAPLRPPASCRRKWRWCCSAASRTSIARCC